MSDNKQTQEPYSSYFGNHTGYIVMADFNKIRVCGQIEKEEHAALIAEAFNVKHLSGKGPKELWEINCTLIDELKLSTEDFIKLAEQRKALAERVKELEKIMNEIAASTRGYANATISRVNRLSMKALSND